MNSQQKMIELNPIETSTIGAPINTNLMYIFHIDSLLQFARAKNRIESSFPSKFEWNSIENE